MDNILVPVSPGEVLDKITILEIKSERMDDPAKVANVQVELDLLQSVWADTVKQDETTAKIHQQLKQVNEELWVIEDEIRDQERIKAFDDTFVQLARSVYVTNDRRARLKKELNLHLGSQIVEEKSYQAY